MKSNIGVDMVNVFLNIFNKDVGTKKEANDEGIQQINVEIGVHSDNIEKWNKCKPLIENLANFVTEFDSRKWNINFVKDNSLKFNLPQLEKNPEIEEVSLLSGGLDSFCGHYINIQEKRKTMYLGYSTSQLDIHYIDTVFKLDSMREAITIRVPKLHVKKEHFEQRSRSLLFFALAVYYALEVNAKTINVYENGIMSLNPSLNLRGTTKTTHPKTIHLFKQILISLDINIDFRHPFLFETKGDIIKCLDEKFLNKIKNTRSCSKTTQWIAVKSKDACGVCVPCVLRKISLSYYNLEKYDDDIYVVPYNGSMDQVSDELLKRYKVEYDSTIRYYKEFLRLIRNKTIFNYLDLRENYYKNIKDIDYSNYLTLTNNMLNNFANEVENFLSKYI